MITHVDITLLPADLQEQVLAKYRVALMDPDRRLTYHEAAWLYGYTYLTVRCHVSRGRIRTVGRTPNRRITHAAMRAYLRGKKLCGRTRNALRAQQLQLP